MLTEAKLPIALVGCGNWGQYILRDLNALNCDVTVVCTCAESVDRAVKYGAKQIVESISYLKDPMGIVIATPTSTHLDVLESLLRFNVPIFVEKPLGTNIAQAKSIVAKASERIFVMDKWRYHHGVEALAAISQSKELGAVVGLHIKQFSWGSPHTDVDFIDTLLPHTLTITYEILGQLPEPQHVFSVNRSGKIIALTGLLGAAPWCNFNVAINSPYYCREIILECDLGLAVLNEVSGNVIEIYRTLNAGKNSLGLPEKREIAKEMPLFRELSVFINYLKGDSKPKSDASFGIKIMESIMQIRTLVNAF